MTTFFLNQVYAFLGIILCARCAAGYEKACTLLRDILYKWSGHFLEELLFYLP